MFLDRPPKTLIESLDLAFSQVAFTAQTEEAAS